MNPKEKKLMNPKIKRMYSNRIIRRAKEIKNKEENIKEKTFEISHLNDFTELNTNFNKNPRNTLDKIEHKSVCHFFDIKQNDKMKLKYLKPIKKITNNFKPQKTINI